MLRETRRPLPAKPGVPAKQDYEYERAGTCNIFLAVEPRGQRRTTQVTARRTKIGFVCRMLRTHPVIATVSSNDSRELVQGRKSINCANRVVPAYMANSRGKVPGKVARSALAFKSTPPGTENNEGPFMKLHRMTAQLTGQ